MNSITLDHIVPRPLRGAAGDCSQVWDTRLRLERGRCYRIEAASGSGKSTLCAILTGTRRDYDGSLLLDGRDAAGLSAAGWARLRRDSIAYMPQEPGLFDVLTVRENIDIKNALTHHRSAADIDAMLDALGLAGLADRSAARLSVGQQQRVALVRALSQPFDFLLLDEPVSHLDAEANRRCARLVEQAVTAAGAGLVVTSVGNWLDLQLPYTDLRL